MTATEIHQPFVTQESQEKRYKELVLQFVETGKKPDELKSFANCINEDAFDRHCGLCRERIELERVLDDSREAKKRIPALQAKLQQLRAEHEEVIPRTKTEVRQREEAVRKIQDEIASERETANEANRICHRLEKLEQTADQATVSRLRELHSTIEAVVNEIERHVKASKSRIVVRTNDYDRKYNFKLDRAHYTAQREEAKAILASPTGDSLGHHIPAITDDMKSNAARALVEIDAKLAAFDAAERALPKLRARLSDLHAELKQAGQQLLVPTNFAL